MSTRFIDRVRLSACYAMLIANALAVAMGITELIRLFYVPKCTPNLYGSVLFTAFIGAFQIVLWLTIISAMKAEPSIPHDGVEIYFDAIVAGIAYPFANALMVIVLLNAGSKLRSDPISCVLDLIAALSALVSAWWYIVALNLLIPVLLVLTAANRFRGLSATASSDESLKSE